MQNLFPSSGNPFVILIAEKRTPTSLLIAAGQSKPWHSYNEKLATRMADEYNKREKHAPPEYLARSRTFTAIRAVDALLQLEKALGIKRTPSDSDFWHAFIRDLRESQKIDPVPFDRNVR